jgi:hypothetical protein
MSPKTLLNCIPPAFVVAAALFGHKIAYSSGHPAPERLFRFGYLTS